MTSNEVIITVSLQGGGQTPDPSACDINDGDIAPVPSMCDDATGDGLLSTHPSNTVTPRVASALARVMSTAPSAYDIVSFYSTGGLLSTHPVNTVTPLVASALARDMPAPIISNNSPSESETNK